MEFDCSGIGGAASSEKSSSTRDNLGEWRHGGRYGPELSRDLESGENEVPLLPRGARSHAATPCSSAMPCHTVPLYAATPPLC
jgi:hypothetical protein